MLTYLLTLQSLIFIVPVAFYLSSSTDLRSNLSVSIFVLSLVKFSALPLWKRLFPQAQRGKLWVLNFCTDLIFFHLTALSADPQHGRKEIIIPLAVLTATVQYLIDLSDPDRERLTRP